MRKLTSQEGHSVLIHSYGVEDKIEYFYFHDFQTREENAKIPVNRITVGPLDKDLTNHMEVARQEYPEASIEVIRETCLDICVETWKYKYGIEKDDLLLYGLGNVLEFKRLLKEDRVIDQHSSEFEKLMNEIDNPKSSSESSDEDENEPPSESDDNELSSEDDRSLTSSDGSDQVESDELFQQPRTEFNNFHLT